MSKKDVEKWLLKVNDPNFKPKNIKINTRDYKENYGCDFVCRQNHWGGTLCVSQCNYCKDPINNKDPFMKKGEH